MMGTLSPVAFSTAFSSALFPTFAAPFPWNCKGLWMFESHEALPAREITATLSTTADQDIPHPLTIDAGNTRLHGTLTRKRDYEFSAETQDRAVVLNGTMKMATETGPLKLSVLLEGQSTSGNRVTGILTCTPR